MQQHIKARPELTKEFTSLAAATIYFNEIADQFNLDNKSEESNNQLEAGGRGYDYRLILQK